MRRFFLKSGKMKQIIQESNYNSKGTVGSWLPQGEWRYVVVTSFLAGCRSSDLRFIMMWLGQRLYLAQPCE